MYKCSENEIEEVINLLKRDIKNCIYMYIDIIKYGISDNLDIWIKRENSDISVIIMKYYNSMHIYSTYDKVYDTDIIDIIKKFDFAMISGTPSVINSIHTYIKDKYSIDYGYILKQEVNSHYKDINYIQRAKLDDVYDIARLICSDKEIGGHYTVSILAEQLKDRMINKMGRNYVIKEENNIVAHYGTYAELDNIAVLGGLIVDINKRNKGFGPKLHKFVSSILISEGKNVYLFCHNEKTIRMYNRLGAVICAEYAKLTKI